MATEQRGEGPGALEFLKDWGDGMSRWTERWVPDAFVIVIIVSVFTFVSALIWGFKPEVGVGTRALESVQAWGRGFWDLLTFGMQASLVMMTGYILACSPPVRRLLDGLSGWSDPDKPWQAILVMSLFSMISAWINWGLSLIASAMLALFIVRKNPKVDYRLLVAAAYLGLGCTWHAGLSGATTLLGLHRAAFPIASPYCVTIRSASSRSTGADQSNARARVYSGAIAVSSPRPVPAALAWKASRRPRNSSRRRSGRSFTATTCCADTSVPRATRSHSVSPRLAARQSPLSRSAHSRASQGFNP